MSDVVTKVRFAGGSGWESYRDPGIVDACQRYVSAFGGAMGDRSRRAVEWQRPDMGTSGTHVVECRREYRVIDPRGPKREAC